MLRLISNVGIGNNSVSRMSHDVTPKVGDQHLPPITKVNYVE